MSHSTQEVRIAMDADKPSRKNKWLSYFKLINDTLGKIIMEFMHDGWNAPIKIWAKQVSELTEQGAPAKCAKLSVKHLNIRLCLVSASVQVG